MYVHNLFCSAGKRVLIYNRMQYVCAHYCIHPNPVCHISENMQVTVPLCDEANRSVTDLAQLDLLLFFYVCHETSARLCTSFYGELAVAVKTGAVVVFADVQQQVIFYIDDYSLCVDDDVSYSDESYRKVVTLCYTYYLFVFGLELYMVRP